MAKSTTPSFITTIPLVVTSSAEAELLSRFQAGRQLYNALLGEAMTRMKLVQKYSHYQLAKTLPAKPEQKPLLRPEGNIGIQNMTCKLTQQW